MDDLELKQDIIHAFQLYKKAEDLGVIFFMLTGKNIVTQKSKFLEKPLYTLAALLEFAEAAGDITRFAEVASNELKLDLSSCAAGQPMAIIIDLCDISIELNDIYVKHRTRKLNKIHNKYQ